MLLEKTWKNFCTWSKLNRYWPLEMLRDRYAEVSILKCLFKEGHVPQTGLLWIYVTEQKTIATGSGLSPFRPTPLFDPLLETSTLSFDTSLNCNWRFNDEIPQIKLICYEMLDFWLSYFTISRVGWFFIFLYKKISALLTFYKVYEFLKPVSMGFIIRKLPKKLTHSQTRQIVSYFHQNVWQNVIKKRGFWSPFFDILNLYTNFYSWLYIV